MNHTRNIKPMQSAPRCGARTRSGDPCRSPAANGKGRCRMHGGAKGSGAPNGNNNALKHGLFSGQHLAWRRDINALLRQANKTLKDL